MTDDRRSPEIGAYEEARFEHSLAGDDVQRRLDVLDDIAAHGYSRAIPRLIPMLERDEPYVFVLRGTPLVAELRTRVLETLERLYRLCEEPPDFGPVKVRAPMPAAEAVAEAQAATASMTDTERAALATPIDAWLATQKIDTTEERDALRAYRTLQALGKVAYRLEHVDPESYVTPVQQEIIDGQTRTPRPRPHVRIARKGKPDETLGWVYRKPDGQWVVDFSHAWDAREAAHSASRILGGIYPGGVQRVLFDSDGRPIEGRHGFESDGIIPLDSPETLEILRSVHAQLAEFRDAELNL
jgi:hypothetical protein